MGAEQGQNLVSDRAQNLLKALVEHYIRDGHPVGSKTLAELGTFHLSSASIRNIMAELEEKGYISPVHTSSGRIPTTAGYRFFIDTLLQMRPVDEKEVVSLQLGVSQNMSSSALVQAVSELLSSLTHLVGVVTLPKEEHFIFRHVEFLPLSGKRLLVVLVLNDSEVQNRVMPIERNYSIQDLQQVANYFNAEFSGHSLASIRQTLITGMQKDKAELDALTRLAVELAQNAFSPGAPEKDYVVKGEMNLLEIMEGTPLQKMRALLDAFARKQEMLYVFEKCLKADGIQIFIGSESGYQIFDECSFIAAPYKAGEVPVGVIGVIGPMRLPYGRVIPLVDVTARLVSVALTRLQREA